MSTRRSRSTTAVALSAAALLAAAPAAFAHGDEGGSGKALFAKSKARIAGAFDAAAPTAAHERQHEAIDKLVDQIRAMPKGKVVKLRNRALGLTTKSGRAVRLADQDVGPASEYGAWTTPPFKAPTYALHMIMLPTGRVLVISMGLHHGEGRWPNYTGQDVSNNGAAAIWDPARGTGTDAFKQVDPPPVRLDDPKKRTGYNRLRSAPIACSGHVQLPDGRVLVAGGNLEATGDGFGLKMLWLFDPYTEDWVRLKDMNVGRWYPSLTKLPDGRVAILAGHDSSGRNTPSIEVYPADGQAVPGIGTSAVSTSGSAQIKSSRSIPSMYPEAYVMKSGNVSIVGPTPADQGTVNVSTGKWTDGVGFSQDVNRGYASFFPEPGTVDGPDRIFALGGLAPGGALQPLVASIRPELDDTWKTEPSLNLARRNAPAVLLPDGSVVAIGGGLKDVRAVDPMDEWPTRRQPELWDPVTHQWRLGPAQQRPRGYHSTAVLLPDGRVLSGGDDLDSTLFDDDLDDDYDTTFEIYSPPYLFKGPRPSITGWPARTAYGQQLSFAVDPSGPPVTRVTMVAPGANTHAVDMNQRQLELPIVSNDGTTVTVLAPPTAAAAPPGDYMLFALSAAGVPSVGVFTEVLPVGASGHPANDSAPVWDEPVATPTPTAGPGPTVTPTATPTPTITPRPTPTATPRPSRPWWWPPFIPYNP